MSKELTEIFDILSNKGYEQYGGEAVTQLEHALQCAMLAEKAQASKELIIACLFHDLGHLIHNLGGNIADKGIDDRHEYRAISVLSSLFSPAVTEPICLHVEAKRYLCAVEPNYYNSLSPASKHSLKLQGDVFTPTEAKDFIKKPYAQDAIQLRRWDEQAKIPNLLTPSLSDFWSLLF